MPEYPLQYFRKEKKNEKNGYFLAYYSYFETLELLSDAECGRLFRALLKYAKDGEIPEFTGNERFLFPTIRSQIDRDAKRYKEVCEKKSIAAKARWDAIQMHASAGKDKE